MASLQDLRRRIASVRNTRKITKALELVAGARLRRAQTRIEEMRPYADRMQELMIGTARTRSPASARRLSWEPRYTSPLGARCVRATSKLLKLLRAGGREVHELDLVRGQRRRGTCVVDL